MKQHAIAAAAIIVIAAILIVPLAWERQQRADAAQENRYHGFDFALTQNGLWVTEVTANGKLYAIPFYHHPRDAESVVMEPGLAAKFFYPETRPGLVYITFRPDAGSKPVIGGVEISRITGFKYDLLNIETRSALQTRTDDGADQLVVTCADANENITVLQFEPGRFDLIQADAEHPDCIRLSYTSANSSILVADRFAYGLLQIMDS